MKVQENNYGCLGPVATDSIMVIGQPDVAITGPSSVCIGDTATFSVPFANNTFYQWRITGNADSQNANNTVKVYFPALGNVKLYHKSV